MEVEGEAEGRDGGLARGLGQQRDSVVSSSEVYFVRPEAETCLPVTNTYMLLLQACPLTSNSLAGCTCKQNSSLMQTQYY